MRAGLGHEGGAGPAGINKAVSWKGPASGRPAVAPNAGVCAAYRRTPVSLAGLLSVIGRDPALREALGSPGPGDAGPAAGPAATATGADFTAPPALRPFLAAALTGLPGEQGPQPSQDRRFVLAVTASAREAEALTDALGSLLPGEGVAYFPAWETLPHERISPGSDTCSRPWRTLRWGSGSSAEGARTTPQSRVPAQGSLQTADGLGAPPCRELLLTPAVRDRAKQLADDHPGLADVLGKLADGITVEGMEAFAPAIASRMELLLDHVPAGGRVLACDPERIRTRAADLVRTSQEFLAASWVNAAAGGQAPIDLGAAAFRSITEIRSAADDLGLPWWTVTPFESPGAAGDAAGLAEPGGAEEDQAGRPAFSMGASPAEAYRGDTTRALADVRRWLADQWRGGVLAAGHARPP